MLKKTIKFTNFDGKEVEETHFFHLSKAALAKMQLSSEGGYDAHLKRIIEAEDGKAIVEEMEFLIRTSYGKKSPDGNRFIQSDEIFEEFQSSPAYSELFMELCTDAEKSAAFVNGLLPADINAETQKIHDKPQLKPVEGGPKGVRAGVRQGDEQPAQPAAPTPPADTQPPAPTGEPRVLSQKEAEEMDADELQRLLVSGEARIWTS